MFSNEKNSKKKRYVNISVKTPQSQTLQTVHLHTSARVTKITQIKTTQTQKQNRKRKTKTKTKNKPKKGIRIQLNNEQQKNQTDNKNSQTQ